MSIRVSIVEDNGRVRGSLARLIALTDGFECVSEHGSGEEAMAALPKTKPEVVLMDINLPGINGVECVRQLKPLLAQHAGDDADGVREHRFDFPGIDGGSDGLSVETDAAERIARGGARSAQRRFPDDRPHRPESGGFVPAGGQFRREFENLTPREKEVLELPGERFSLQGNRGGDDHQLRHRPHAHPQDLRKTARPFSRTEAVAKHLGRAVAPGAIAAANR
jgi:hypothetical protein